MTDTLYWLWQSHNYRLHTIFLLHGMFNGNDPILYSKLLFGLHGKIRPEVYIFSFYWLTGHEADSRKGFLKGENQFCSGKGHCCYGWTA
jgi:hypothetical protein